MRVREDAATDPVPGQDSSGGWWPALRPLILRLHFYGGVLVAPLLIVAATTGLLYVFTPQLEEAFYPRELHVAASGTARPLADQVQAAQQAHPYGTLSSVRPGPTPTDTTRVIFESPELPESYFRTVFIDPYTAEVRGILETYGDGQALPLRTWFDQLHRNLLLGDPGRLYSELAASWLWLVVLGGLLLWVGRRRSSRRLRYTLAPRLRPPGRQRVLSWHGAIGSWAALGLLFLSATGLTWSTYAGEHVSQLRAALNAETPTVATDSVSPAPGGDVGIDRVLQVARGHGLHGPVEITLPAEQASAYSVKQIRREWPVLQDEVAIQAGTGRVTDVVRFEDYPLLAKLSRWGIDAHMGLLFGWVNQLVLAALVGGFLVMIILGYRMWWQRRPSRNRFMLGAPPARGAWRRVPGKVLAPIILLAAFVGYFLPMLGASLVVFLALDIALGQIAARKARMKASAGADFRPQETDAAGRENRS